MTDLTCDQLDGLLPDLFDGSLNATLRDAAVRHLATCDHCRLVVDDLERVSDIAREHGRLRLPEAARDRIRRALEER